MTTIHPQDPWQAIGWSVPLPLVEASTPRLPAFPVDALPDWLYEFCVQQAESSQTPVDAIATLVLGVLATTIQGRVVVRLRPDWTEATCLFLMVVMDSGTKKSATFKAAFEPIRKAEQELRDACMAKHREALRSLEMAEVRYDVAMKSVRAKSSGEDVTQREQEVHSAGEERDAARARAAALEPPELYADDATPEAFTELIARHKRMTIASPEGGWFSTFGGRYNDGRANLEVLLKAYTGEGMRIHRKGAETLYIPAAICSIVVAIQPSVLDEMRGTKGAEDRGLLARFLKTAPLTRRGYRKMNPNPIQPAVQELYDSNVKRILYAYLSINDVEFVLSADADAKFRALREEHERQSRPGGLVHEIDKWAEKHAGNVVRISAALHVAKYAEQAQDIPIEAETIVDAIRIGDYFIEFEIHLSGVTRQRSDLSLAENIIGWIKDQRSYVINASDILQSKRNTAGLENADKVRDVLGLLCDYGYVRPCVRGGGQGPGRPSKKWEVNPHLHPRNPKNSNFQDIQDVGCLIDWDDEGDAAC
jgi:replicative DNA helicase